MAALRRARALSRAPRCPLAGALLHLGDVAFEGDERGCAVVDAGPLRAAAALLGVEADELSRQLRTLRRAEEVVATAAHGLRWRGSTPDARNSPRQPTSGRPPRAVSAYA